MDIAKTKLISYNGKYITIKMALVSLKTLLTLILIPKFKISTELVFDYQETTDMV